MTASLHIVVGVIGLSLMALYARAEKAPEVNSHRALMIASAAKVILRDDGRVVLFHEPNFRQKPVLLENAENIVAIAGDTSGLALRNDGTVLSWSGKCTNEEQPVCTYPAAKVIPKLRPTIAIASNGATHLAVLGDGSVWGWGNDWRGLISGLTPVVYKSRMVGTPQKLPFPVPITAVSVGDLQGMAIDRERHVWTWASLSSPTLRGIGEEVSHPSGFSAVKVANIPPAKQVAAGIYSTMLTPEGEVWIWGESLLNQIRRGSPAPKRVEGFGDGVFLNAEGSIVLSVDRSGILRMIGSPIADAFRSRTPRAYEFYETPLELTKFKNVKEVSADLLGIGVIHFDGAVTYGISNLQLGD
jgi:hypothetical protein